MGVCVTLRDEPGDLTASEIQAKLNLWEDSDLRSYQRQLTEAQLKLKTFEDKSVKKLQVQFAAEKEKALKEYERRKKKFERESKKHADALNEVLRLERAAFNLDVPSESVIRGTLKFAAEQIRSTIDYDYKRQPEKPEKQSFQDWFKVRKEALAWYVQYYQKKVTELTEQQEKFNRSSEYKKFVEFVNSQF